MRYMLSARVHPEKRRELLEAIERRRFGAGFPLWRPWGDSLSRPGR